MCSVSSEILNAKGSPNVSGKIISVLATAWKLSKYGVITGLYFPAFGQNTKRYFVSLHIQSECGKIWTRNNFEFGHFSGSEHLTQFEYWILCESPFTRTWKWNWKCFSKQLYWKRNFAGVFSCKFSAYFQNTFPKNTYGRLLLHISKKNVRLQIVFNLKKKKIHFLQLLNLITAYVLLT